MIVVLFIYGLVTLFGSQLLFDGDPNRALGLWMILMASGFLADALVGKTFWKKNT